MSPHRTVIIITAAAIILGVLEIPTDHNAVTTSAGAAESAAETAAEPVPQPDPELDRLVEWGERVFAEAGLSLPDNLTVEFDPTLDTCDGPGGRYRSGNGPRIIMCASRDSRPARRTLLHELAHAWEDANMDDTRRAKFQAAKGMPTWLDHDHDWGHRAGEHVAEIIAWGLTTDGLRLVSVVNDGCTALAADYEWLTGTPPPAGLPEGCDPTPVTTTTFAGGIV